MKKYSIKEPIPTKVKDSLSAYPKLMQELLFRRGIKTSEDADEFLNPDYEKHIHDPFLIKDMDIAVKRILSAIRDNEKIVIYSDYDCDGIPGGVILHDFFKKIEHKHVSNYIPHRHDEGYSLNINAIKMFSKENVKLIITVDCGITDVKEVEEANSLGIDVIITDHHLPTKKLPKAHAILNSKQEDDNYPYDMLCGAGVACKLVQGLIAKGDFGITPGWEKWLLDMAGLSTIADIVPLTGENRVIAYYGLKVFRKSPRPGVQELCRKAKIRLHNITEDDIGFMVAPRINAASRMGKPMEAFYLLSTDDREVAMNLSEYLNKLNDERKGIVASIVKEIRKRISKRADIKKVIVIGDLKWKPALLGLVAHILMEEYGRPICIWGKESDEIIKGSCRSTGDVNLVDMMAHQSDFFLDYGGHPFSSGFSVSRKNAHKLEEVLIASYLETKIDTTQTNELMIDKQMSLEDVSWQTYSIIEKLAPFGLGNPKPIFLFKNIYIENTKQFGKEKNHMQIDFLKDNGKKVSAIGFFTKPEQFKKDISEGKTIDLVATMEKSMFRNFPELRLRIVDIL